MKFSAAALALFTLHSATVLAYYPGNNYYARDLEAADNQHLIARDAYVRGYLAGRSAAPEPEAEADADADAEAEAYDADSYLEPTLLAREDPTAIFLQKRQDCTHDNMCPTGARCLILPGQSVGTCVQRGRRGGGGGGGQMATPPGGEKSSGSAPSSGGKGKSGGFSGLIGDAVQGVEHFL